MVEVGKENVYKELKVFNVTDRKKIEWKLHEN